MICCGEIMMTFNLVRLERSQINPASEILAKAFDDDPVLNCLLSQSDRMKTNALKSLFKGILLTSLPYNHIYTTVGSLKGVAAWLPPNHSHLNIFHFLPTVFSLTFKLGLSKVGRLISILSVLEEYHKGDLSQPHWYLNLLGVSPAHQGQGIGSLLLQPILQQADSQRLPCYLETSTPKAVCFYQKNGFEVLKTLDLLEASSLIWTMKREPLSIK
jgi:GNAT superfamily N-acetyltransferase